MNNRLLVFARKPAPVQVTWLGYPNTSGLDAMDYRLTDAWADPRNDGDQYYTERLVRLAGGFLCYRPPGDTPRPQPPAAAAPVTFGSCNNLAKVTPRVIAVWAAILKRVASSRLLLKSKPLADEDSRRRVEDLFAGHGIAAERLEMMGWVASASHLAVYGRIDIALDPFPYGGTTTTCEALWMGVPVVTLAGDRHSGRVGLSLLGKLGLDDLAASSPEDYVERAVALAGDRGGAIRPDRRQGLYRKTGSGLPPHVAALVRAAQWPVTIRLALAMKRMPSGIPQTRTQHHAAERRRASSPTVEVVLRELRSRRVPSACVPACGRGGRLRPFPGPYARTASHMIAAVSFRGRRLRAASSFSALSGPGQRCCRGRLLARRFFFP
jgi:hypothetical protein